MTNITFACDQQLCLDQHTLSLLNTIYNEYWKVAHLQVSNIQGFISVKDIVLKKKKERHNKCNA